MKHALIIATLFASSVVFAEGGPAAPAAPAPAASPAPATPETKLTKKQAKVECKKENPKLKGKELKACVAGKIK